MADPRTAGRIVAVGDVIDDIVVVPHGAIRPDTDTPSAISRSAGGSAANTAVWLGSIGAQVDFVGTVGAQDVERHAALFEAAGVRPVLFGHPELPTGTIIVLVDGEQRSMLTERGANAVNDPERVTTELLAEASVLFIAGHSILGAVDAEPWRTLIERARAAGVAVVVAPGSAGFIADFGPDGFRSIIAGASVIIPSLGEGRLLTGLEEPAEVAAALAETFPLVVMTLGADGVIIAGTTTGTVEAIPATVVDPTGAGDAFAAGFIAAWSAGIEPIESARRGAALAARAVATLGGRPA